MISITPLISIVTVCYNAEKTIADTINSVNSQSYENIEHIFIDGGSDDKTCELIRTKSTRRSYFKSESDCGIYNAMNKGLSQASGVYVCFLNADDVYANRHVVSDVVSVLTTSIPDLLYTDIKYVDYRQPKNNVRTWIAGKFRSTSLKFGWMPPHPGCFVHRTTFLNLGGFNESFSIAGDYDFLVRLCNTSGAKIEYLPLISVIMKTGGISNRNFRSLCDKMVEDYSIITRNNIGGFVTLILKSLRKVSQFFRHK